MFPPLAWPSQSKPIGAAQLDKGETMPTIIGHHDVKDAKHWLASPTRQEFFGPLGVTNIRTFVDPQNPTRVAVLIGVPHLGPPTAAVQNKGAARAGGKEGGLPRQRGSPASSP